MANAYFQMYAHTIFAVKYRAAQIQNSWKHNLMSVIGNLTNETGCKCIIVNGMPDHVHSFFGFKPTIRIADVMKSVKSKSSKWINEQGYLKDRFEWQAGYGCFTYSESQVKSVFQYIQEQEKHHRNLSFLDEYRGILEKFRVDFDEMYIFKEME